MKKSHLLLSVLVASTLAVPATLAFNGSQAAPQTVQAATSINAYIASQGLKNPAITTKKSTFTEIMGYRNGVGKPEGIVIHDTGNDASTLDNEVAYMQREWNISSWAYVHAFVDSTRIVNIHPTNYAVWGAGAAANARFIQIELVHAHSYDAFARSVNNDAYYAAYLLKQYGLPVTSAISSGSGSIWAHSTVTKYLGGTDHGDPDSYFAKWGYSMAQFFQLVQTKYNQIGGSTVALDTVVSSEATQQTATVQGNNSTGLYYLTDKGFKFAAWSSTYNGQSFDVTRLAKTKKGMTMALLSQNGKALAWVSTEVLSMVNNGPTSIVNKETVNTTVNVNANTQSYYLLNSGFSNATVLAAQTDAKVISKATLKNGQVYYLLAKNGVGYAWINSANTNDGSSIVAPPTTDPSTGATSETITGVARINYIPGYGTVVWGAPGKNVSNRYLAHGSRWKVFEKVTLTDGTTWYKVGTNQYLNGKYVVIE